MNSVIFGAEGQLAKCLHKEVKDNSNFTFVSKSELDITNQEQLEKYLSNNKFSFVLNLAAYTNVDKAEEEPETSFEINTAAPRNISKICKKLDITLVHISTDYVFDGNSRKPYLETDIVNPLSVYGNTKLMGENEIIKSGCKYYIIRTSWVFSEFGNNFLKTMIRMSASESIKIINDQVGCPTYAGDLARCILKIIKKEYIKDKHKNIYNFCGDTECSWYEFATYIFSEMQLNGLQVPKLIYEVSSKEYPSLAVRPSYSVLNCQKVINEFKVSKSNWRKAVKEMVNNI